ncbi:MULTISPECIES: hypothetical protein [Bacteroides]|uniref:hypothetical protein n=1 Tax=Bacteroides TaxID=816 RepID=UPI001314F465|nr:MULTISPECIES: hypothetical protein [Bacteroides]MBS7574676.1 hypothetical protein [Bacteroides propionicigenes]
MVHKIPTGWYGKYQPLVHQIPTVGTWNTNRWYTAYLPLERNVPTADTDKRLIR